ncbi:hypothetical protein BCR36DRAFT_580710 [Piromyces finnis]|uniref:Uncharacterized protein n=1 Tax=Piromyces finnis TaxID=1754191 RepID=A0A1Y1VJD3_9FUNG|nr:hypothetical protein BCR36DRAFT_580710 [Piromyces finnis]|eukprot:ORX57299.1 hypothetical protein BCR36DRAFT_580710 [Piromyces finnis]
MTKLESIASLTPMSSPINIIKDANNNAKGSNGDEIKDQNNQILSPQVFNNQVYSDINMISSGVSLYNQASQLSGDNQLLNTMNYRNIMTVNSNGTDPSLNALGSNTFDPFLQNSLQIYNGIGDFNMNMNIDSASTTNFLNQTNTQATTLGTTTNLNQIDSSKIDSNIMKDISMDADFSDITKYIDSTLLNEKIIDSTKTNTTNIVAPNATDASTVPSTNTNSATTAATVVTTTVPPTSVANPTTTTATTITTPNSMTVLKTVPSNTPVAHTTSAIPTTMSYISSNASFIGTQTSHPGSMISTVPTVPSVTAVPTVPSTTSISTTNELSNKSSKSFSSSSELKISTSNLINKNNPKPDEPISTPLSSKVHNLENALHNFNIISPFQKAGTINNTSTTSIPSSLSNSVSIVTESSVSKPKNSSVSTTVSNTAASKINSTPAVNATKTSKQNKAVEQGAILSSVSSSGSLNSIQRSSSQPLPVQRSVSQSPYIPTQIPMPSPVQVQMQSHPPTPQQSMGVSMTQPPTPSQAIQYSPMMASQNRTGQGQIPNPMIPQTHNQMTNGQQQFIIENGQQQLQQNFISQQNMSLPNASPAQSAGQIQVLQHPQGQGQNQIQIQQAPIVQAGQQYILSGKPQATFVFPNNPTVNQVNDIQPVQAVQAQNNTAQRIATTPIQQVSQVQRIPVQQVLPSPGTQGNAPQPVQAQVPTLQGQAMTVGQGQTVPTMPQGSITAMPTPPQPSSVYVANSAGNVTLQQSQAIKNNTSGNVSVQGQIPNQAMFSPLNQQQTKITKVISNQVQQPQSMQPISQPSQSQPQSQVQAQSKPVITNIPTAVQTMISPVQKNGSFTTTTINGIPGQRAVQNIVVQQAVPGQNGQPIIIQQPQQRQTISNPSIQTFRMPAQMQGQIQGQQVILNQPQTQIQAQSQPVIIQQPSQQIQMIPQQVQVIQQQQPSMPIQNIPISTLQQSQQPQIQQPQGPQVQHISYPANMAQPMQISQIHQVNPQQIHFQSNQPQLIQQPNGQIIQITRTPTYIQQTTPGMAQQVPQVRMVQLPGQPNNPQPYQVQPSQVLISNPGQQQGQIQTIQGINQMTMAQPQTISLVNGQPQQQPPTPTNDKIMKGMNPPQRSPYVQLSNMTKSLKGSKSSPYMNTKFTSSTNAVNTITFRKESPSIKTGITAASPLTNRPI